MQVLRGLELTELCDKDVLDAPPGIFLTTGLDPFPMSAYSDEVKTYEPFKARLEVRMASNCIVFMKLKGHGAYSYHTYRHRYADEHEASRQNLSHGQQSVYV